MSKRTTIKEFEGRSTRVYGYAAKMICSCGNEVLVDGFFLCSNCGVGLSFTEVENSEELQLHFYLETELDEPPEDFVYPEFLEWVETDAGEQK